MNQQSENIARGSGEPDHGVAVEHPGRSGKNVYIDTPPPENHPRGSGQLQGQEDKNNPESRPRGGYLDGNSDKQPKSHPGRSGENLYREEFAPALGNHPKGKGAPQSENSHTLTPEQLAVVAKRIGEIMNPEPDQSLTA